MLHDPDKVLDRIGLSDPALMQVLASLNASGDPCVRLALREYRTVLSVSSHLTRVHSGSPSVDGARRLPFESLGSSPEGTVFWTEISSGLVDASIARQCGMLAVEIGGFDCLAELDGMAATAPPAWRLDAYVALRFHVIPIDSLFFSNRREFQRLLGPQLYATVVANVRRPQPELVLTMPVVLKQ